MLKKMFVTGLMMIVLIAIGASAYNTYAESRNEPDAISKVSMLIPPDETAVEDTNIGLESDAISNQESNMIVQNETTANETTTDVVPVVPDENSLDIYPSQSPNTAYQASGQGNRYGGQARGGGRGNRTGTGNGAPQPQNGFQEWVTLLGTVSSYNPPELTLTTIDGQEWSVQLSNVNYLNEIGFSLIEGETVTVKGFYDHDGGFTAGEITLQSGETTYTLRDQSGRPEWAGGPNRG